ncbi:MAG: protein kinase [Planctomycetes bacterium]|nr:protein kinase [Planctomycetota bacterium]
MDEAQVTTPPPISSPTAPAPAALMQGSVEGRDLLEVVKLLNRTKKTGVLTARGTENRAEIFIKQGAVVAAFYNDMSGAAALTRGILIGKAVFAFEAHEGRFPNNVLQDTTFIIDSVEKILAEYGDRLWGSDGQAAALGDDAEDDGLSPSEEQQKAPETLLIAAFSPPETGRVIGKCKLEAEIGRGASSIVYRGHHRSLGIDVAVKVLLQGAEGEQEHRSMTRNEAQLLARLNHPNILRIFDFDDRGQFPYVVMEYVDSLSLGGMIGEHGAIDVDVALPIFCQVAEGLAYAHTTCGLVHCDLKPTNILITKGMQAKVADFGLAKAVRMTQAQRDARARLAGIAGTPAYIAPEQVQDGIDNANHRSDVYSLGATFYHALTGRPPFEDPDPIELMAKRLKIDPIPVHIANPSVDRSLCDLVMSMLVRDPVQRIHTCEDVLNVLTAIMEKRDEDEARRSGNADKIIRRRSSFWNYVPIKLFKRTTEDGRVQVG